MKNGKKSAAKRAAGAVVDPGRAVRGLYARYVTPEAGRRPEDAWDAARQAAAAIGAAEPGFAPDPLAAGFLHFLLHDLSLAVPDPGGAGDAPFGNLRQGTLDLDSLYGDARDRDGRHVGDPALRDPASPQIMRLAGGRGDVPAGLPWTGAEDWAEAAPADPPDAFMPPDPNGGAAARASRPLLADQRNGGDPLLENFALAALRLHNQAVAALSEAGVPETDPTNAFLRARGELRLLVQWLALHDALPTLAGSGAFERAAKDGARLHARFADRLAGGVAPAPLEVAAALGPLIALSRAPSGPDGAALTALLDTGRAAGLADGQALHGAIAGACGLRTAPLTKTELAEGPAAGAFEGALAERTPLALYLLREAEARGGGETLGPLGGALLAQTLVGLAARDPMSCWRRPGERGRWRPEDGVLRLDGAPIETVEAFLSAATEG